MAEPKKKGSKLVMLLKVFVLLFLVLVLTIVGVGLFVLDGKYEVSRSTVIKADRDDIHENIADLRKWPAWLPFSKHDPSIKTTIIKPTGVGAHQTWKGDHDTGELTFTSVDEEKGVKFDMLMMEQYKSTGEFIYEDAGNDSTKVTWKMTGQSDGIMGHYMAAFMDKLVGTYFEEGLADIKKVSEAKK